LLPHLEGADTILDVAGADGYVADAILRRTTRPAITVVDLEEANATCAAVFAAHVASGRLQTVAHDARTLDLGRTFDAVLMTEVTELFGEADKRRVVAGALRHLKPGGTLIVTKLTLGEATPRTEALAIFSLKMYVKWHGAYLETDEALAALLREAGLEPASFTSGDKTVYVCRSTPPTENRA
jgi:2-polyprenyl-3-methyl-5-hydroxy-6-metoxy-1,4-benzoquinol methylase